MKELPEVNLTALLVRRGDVIVGVARLSNDRGHAATRCCQVKPGLTKRAALLDAARAAERLLKRPARIHFVSNNGKVCKAFQNPRRLSLPHEVVSECRTGDAMGENGRQAYASGVKAIKKIKARAAQMK